MWLKWLVGIVLIISFSVLGFVLVKYWFFS